MFTFFDVTAVLNWFHQPFVRIFVFVELLGEPSNRAARSHNVFVCMYVYIHIYIRIPYSGKLWRGF